MDRSTENKFLNAFTTKVDLTNPQGALVSEKLERQIMGLLKPMMDEMKAFRQSSVNRDTGKRETTYFYQGGRGIGQSVKAMLDSLPDALGFADQASAPFKISEQHRRQFTQSTERILSTRAAAEVQAGALRAGGMSRTDKNSGFTTILVPSREAPRFQAIVDRSDAKYLSGEFSSASYAGAGPANIHERAYAALARQDRVASAKQNAAADFIKKHPESLTAKKAALMAKKKSADQRNKAGRLAKSILTTALGTLLGLFATAVGFLSKILSGVEDTARNTNKMMTDSAKFNLSPEKMQDFNYMAAGMGFKGANPFIGAFGNIMGKFGDPTVVKSGIMQAAPLFQGSTKDLLPFVTGGNRDLPGFLYQSIADIMNISASGRGGVVTGLSQAEALKTNIGMYGNVFGAESADILTTYAAERKKRMLAAGLDPALSGKESAATVQANLEGWFLGKGAQAGTANPVEQSKQDMMAAQQANQSVTDLGVIWKSLGDTIFTKMLEVLGEIASYLRSWLRPLIATFDPAWGAKENAIAVRENDKLTKLYTENLGLQAPFLPKETQQLMKNAKGPYKDPLLFAATAMSAYNNGGKDDVVPLATQKLMETLGLSQTQLVDMVGANPEYFQTARALLDLRKQKGAGIQAGALAMFGAQDRPGDTQMPGTNIYLIEARAREIAIDDINRRAHRAGLLEKDKAETARKMGTALPGDSGSMNDFTVEGRARTGAATDEVDRKFSYRVLFREAYDALKAKMGQSIADSAVAQIAAGTGKERMVGGVGSDNRAVVEVQFTDPAGKKQALQFSVDASGINTEVLSKSKSDYFSVIAKTVGGSQQTTK